MQRCLIHSQVYTVICIFVSLNNICQAKTTQVSKNKMKQTKPLYISRWKYGTHGAGRVIDEKAVALSLSMQTDEDDKVRSQDECCLLWATE